MRTTRDKVRTRSCCLSRLLPLILCGLTALLLLRALLVAGHLREALLERDGERDERVARVVLVDPRLDLREPLVLLADVVALGEVHEVGDGLRGEQLQPVDDVDLEEDWCERMRGTVGSGEESDRRLSHGLGRYSQPRRAELKESRFGSFILQGDASNRDSVVIFT